MGQELGVEIPEEVGRKALSLDRHFLQLRYVNTFYSGTPVDYYALWDAGSLSDILTKKYEVLERYLSKLRRELDFKLIILFGLLARGIRLRAAT